MFNRLFLLFFYLISVNANAMVSDVINLGSLPPIYFEVHKILSSQILKAQTDHLLDKPPTLIKSYVKHDDLYKSILETGYDNYFSCALTFETSNNRFITILPGMTESRIIIANDETPSTLNKTITTDAVYNYTTSSDSLVFVSGKQDGSNKYISIFDEFWQKKDENILSITARSDKRKKDSEKVCFDSLATKDSVDFFVNTIEHKLEKGELIVGIILNGSSIRAACDSCLGALGILQKLGIYSATNTTEKKIA